MANKYFSYEKSPYSGKYIVTFTEVSMEKVSALVPRNWNKPLNYNNFIIQLFGFEKPSYFFSYIVKNYNAVIMKNPHSIWKEFKFDSAADVIKFSNECNRRFTKCVEAGYFVSN